MQQQRNLPAACAVVVAFGSLLAAGLAAGAAARTDGARAERAAVPYVDAAGDANGAPDITAVAVDEANGIVAVVVDAVGIQTSGVLVVALDTDGDAATGYYGSEYALVYAADESGSAWDVLRWDGGDWQQVPRSSTMSFASDGDVCRWLLGTSDLGGATGFGLYVATARADANGNVVADRAPDAGTWVFDPTASTATQTTTQPAVSPRKVVDKPLILPPTAAPATPRAGAPVTVSFPVVHSDDGDAVAGGKIVASASVAGKSVPQHGRLRNGVASVSLTIPRGTRGRQLKVRVTITVGGRSTSRVATYAIG